MVILYVSTALTLSDADLLACRALSFDEGSTTICLKYNNGFPEDISE
jgi:hypothetical protein